MINLNVGSFRTYTKLVNSQSLDSGIMLLDYHMIMCMENKTSLFYLENKLEYLNSENEWYFDNTTKYLYVYYQVMSSTTTNIRKTTKLFVKYNL